MPSNKHAHAPRRAFSLVEIMVVVVIIGLLASVVTYATANYLDKAKRQRARADIAVYAGGIKNYHTEKGRYPSNQEGLRTIVPEYVEKLQNDPWGRPYQYLSPGRSAPFEIISYGADGLEGGTGSNADISSADADLAQPKK